MAAPTFVGAGAGVTIASGSAACNATGSGVAVGDIIVLQVLQDGAGASAVSYSAISGIENLAGTASSLTTLATDQPCGATVAKQHLRIGRATSTTCSVTVATTGDDLYYRLYVFRGVTTGTALSDIIENVTAGSFINTTGATAAITGPTVTVLGAQRLVCAFTAVDDDNPLGAYGTGRVGVEWVEAIAEFASATGTDGAIQLQTGIAHSDYNYLTDATGALVSIFQNTSQQILAQRFLAPATTTLDEIKLLLYAQASPSDDLVVSIRTESGSDPSSTIVGSAVTIHPTIAAYTEITVTGLGASVTSGTPYWIHISRTGGLNATNYYAGRSQSYVKTGLGWKAWNGSSWQNGSNLLCFYVPGGTAGSAVGGGTFTMAAADNWGIVSFALKPQAAAGPFEYEDSGTISLDLEASGTEYRTQEYADTGTIALALTASGTDLYEKVPILDSGTISLVLTPSGTDVYGRELTDSGTIYLDLQLLGVAAGDQRAQAEVSVYNDVSNLKGINFMLRWSAGTTSGYRIGFVNDSTSGVNDIWTIARLDSGAETFLNFGNVTNYQVGDIVGVDIVGTSITLWRERASVRTNIGTASDATYSSGDIDYTIISPVDFNFINYQETLLGAVDIAQFVDSGIIYLDLTASGTTVRELLDTGAIYLDLTASGTEIREQVDSGTIYVDLTPSGVEVYGREFIDTGTIYLTLTLGAAEELFAGPVLDDFSYADTVVNPAIWSTTDVWGGSNVLRQADGAATTSPGSYITNWWLAEQFGPDTEVSVTINALPGNDSAIWLEARLQEPGTGNFDGYHLEWYTRGTADELRIVKVINHTGNFMVASVYEDMQVGSELGLEVTGTDPVTIIGYVKHPGGEWTEMIAAVDSSSDRIQDEGYVALGIGSSNLARADNFKGKTKVPPGTTHQAVDSGTITLALTPSLAEVYTPLAGVDYADTGTVYVDLTASGTELREITDSGTVYVDLAASGVEIREISDSGTVYVELEASGIEYRTQEYLDTGSVYVDLTASGTELREIVDTGQVYVELEASGTDTAQLVEAAEVYLDLTASGIDEYTGSTAVDYVDSGTAYLDLSLTAAEAYGYADTGQASLTLTPSGTEIRERVDAGTISLTLLATGSEVQQFVESGTVPLQLTPSGTEFKGVTYADSATTTIALTPSSTEAQAAVDSGQVGISLTASATETTQAAEVATVDLRLSPSGTEALVPQGQDSGTIPVAVSITGTEFATLVDIGTVTLDLEASGTEYRTQVYTDTGTTYLDLVASGVEEAVRESLDSGSVYVDLTASGNDIVTYIETGAISVVLTASGSDTIQVVDVGTVTVVLTASGIEGVESATADAATTYLDLAPTGIDVLEHVSTGTIGVLLTPELDEEIAAQDIATIRVRLTPSGEEVTTVLLMDLHSRAYLRWQTTTGEQTYGSYSYVNWHTTARKRWKSDHQQRLR